MIKKVCSKSEQPVDWRSNCPVSCALDVLGDKWSLLVIRDLIIHGSRTYSEFGEAPERISTNILASRLKILVRLELIQRLDPDGLARGNAYELTESGMALKPVLLAYGKWANTHLKKFNADIVGV